MPRTYHTFDLIIIGGGTAGLSALKEALKYTNNVVLIHDDSASKSCAYTNFMSSKSLIHTANLYHSRHKMAEAGIKDAEKLELNIPEILHDLRQQRMYFINSFSEELQDLSHYIIKGRGRFDSSTRVRANGRLLHTKATVIATGALPYIPKQFMEFESKILTTDNLFAQKKLPRSIAVIGLGPVGLEMAQALSRLGIKVTAIERLGAVGDIADRDINNMVINMLKKEMRLWLNCKPDISHAGEGLLIKHNDESVEVNALFLATGSKANLGSLGLKRIGVPLDGENIPHFNSITMQVKGQPIYIAGDATDERKALHEASDEGMRAAYYALNGSHAKILAQKVPMSIIFTNPTIAIIGDSHYSMRWNGVKTGEASFIEHERAVIEKENYGKIRITADANNGRLRSCEMMAPKGEHLAHLIAFALEQRLTVKQMLAMPFYNPSFEEALQIALANIAT